MFSQNLDVFMFFSPKRNIMEKQAKHKKYSIKFKKEVVECAKNIQLIARLTNSEYTKKVWKKQANSLRQVTKKHASTFHLEGGRKVKLDAVENGVLNFYRECRDKKLHVSRKRLKLKALEIYQRLVNENLAEPDGFTASEGWASKFL